MSVILNALELIINCTEKWAKIQNIFNLSDKFDGDTSFGEVMQTISDDTLQLLNTKAKIVQFVGKSTLGGVGNAVNTATKSLEVSALNRTEMAIIKKKKAMIEGVFGLKRRAMKAIAGFWNDSVNSIHNAAEAVHNGIESIHNGIDNGIESINNGIDEGKCKSYRF